MKRGERKAMTDFIAETFGAMGCSGVSFADENGRTVHTIKAKPPPDVPCEVPAHGGGKVVIKKGDHVRLWFRDSGAWKQEATGTVISVCPERNMMGSFHLAYLRDNRDANEGASSCTLTNGAAGWHRVVEKLS